MSPVAPGSIVLPEPPEEYTPEVEAERNRILEEADLDNLKRARDVEPGRLILSSPDGTRWEITVDNAGALSTTSL